MGYESGGAGYFLNRLGTSRYCTNYIFVFFHVLIYVIICYVWTKIFSCWFHWFFDEVDSFLRKLFPNLNIKTSMWIAPSCIKVLSRHNTKGNKLWTMNFDFCCCCKIMKISRRSKFKFPHLQFIQSVDVVPLTQINEFNKYSQVLT